MLLTLGKVYTLHTRAPSLLGDRLESVKVVGVVDFDTASTFIPAAVKYRAIYPLLPANSPDDPRSTAWYRLKTPSGEILTIAEQWIDPNSVELIEQVTIGVTIPNASMGDIERLRSHLTVLGFKDFDIKKL